VGAMQELTSELSVSERDRIFGGTAIQFYRLQLPGGKVGAS
jgi:predicted TIM-barrel fold metal-dependent hydrolase